MIGNDLTIGRFAMVGMGSLVTRSVPDFHLVIGSPARSVGCVCRCGQLLLHFAERGTASVDEVTCVACGRIYDVPARETGSARVSMNVPVVANSVFPTNDVPSGFAIET